MKTVSLSFQNTDNISFIGNHKNSNSEPKMKFDDGPPPRSNHANHVNHVTVGANGSRTHKCRSHATSHSHLMNGHSTPSDAFADSSATTAAEYFTTDYLEQAFQHHNHYHTSTPNFQEFVAGGSYQTLPLVGGSLLNHSESSSSLGGGVAKPPPVIWQLKKPENCFQAAVAGSSGRETTKERNYLNHHPYGTTFWYSKKNGRSGGRSVKRRGHDGAFSSSRRNATFLKNSSSSGSYVLQQATSGNNKVVPYHKQNGGPGGGLVRSSTTFGGSSSFTDLTGLGGSRSMNAFLDEDGGGVEEDEDGSGGLERRANGDLAECGCKRCVTRAMNNPEKALNSVSQIDKISRVVFPLTFLAINIFYWYNYLKHSERIDLSFES